MSKKIRWSEKNLVVTRVRMKKVAGETGLEPAAFCVTGRRYNQLNYSPEEYIV